MEKVEAYNKAWRLGVESNDFSLVDEIYHPDFKAVDSVSGLKSISTHLKKHYILSRILS